MNKVYNTGIYKKGKFNCIDNKKAYSVWKGMLQRCYDKKTLKKFPTYKGCVVCKEWLCFQNFAEWFYLNYIEGYTLDKDILGNGKLYSPETCCFVPNHINNILHKNIHNQSYLCIGVIEQDGRFRVRVNTLNKKKKHIGYFNTEKEASIAYKKAKIKVIKEVVEFYKLDNIIHKALINKLKAA